MQPSFRFTARTYAELWILTHLQPSPLPIKSKLSGKDAIYNKYLNACKERETWKEGKGLLIRIDGRLVKGSGHGLDFYSVRLVNIAIAGFAIRSIWVLLVTYHRASLARRLPLPVTGLHRLFYAIGLLVGVAVPWVVVSKAHLFVWRTYYVTDRKEDSQTKADSSEGG